jgi:hypothetical protein
MLSWYCFRIFFSTLVTFPVAPIITSITKHFIFYIRQISILAFLYLCILYVRGVPCHHGVARPQVADGGKASRCRG